jgi:hypothetical protein
MYNAGPSGILEVNAMADLRVWLVIPHKNPPGKWNKEPVIDEYWEITP